MNKTQESMLEKALQSTWDAKERFYQKTKGMTSKEILEKLEGRTFSFTLNRQEPVIPFGVLKG
ncbi:MAG: hypothetical protein LBT39_01660 [Treponema sp.]|jgi:hypothetical protein|nr:hypothetical protein [Treponema sp.]